MNDNFLDTAFSDKEQKAIASTTVVNDNNPYYNTAGGNNTTDKIFLLSLAEVTNVNYFAQKEARVATSTAYVAGGGRTGSTRMNEVNIGSYWWLRSPGFLAENAAFVNPHGAWDDAGVSTTSPNYAVRPAFNLNSSSVLFTSAAVGGKSATVGSLSVISDYTGNEWKLTLKDVNHTLTSATTTGVLAAGTTIAVDYDGASTGHKLSAIITDIAGTEVLYYGVLTDNTIARGTANLTLPADFNAATMQVKLFTETTNGDYKTDYASALVELSSSSTYTITFNGNSGTPSVGTMTTGTDGKLASLPTASRSGSYSFDGWYTSAGGGTKVTTSYVFDANTTVYAHWTYTGGGWENPFIDVFEKNWFYDDVRFANENDLMNGTSGNTFSPNVTTTRGMIVTVLYRLAGEPGVSGACPFDDVKSGSYYEDAITWAAANGIVNGYGNGKFGPNDNITREQMAAILYRYADHMGYDVSGRDNLAAFGDADKVSSYALDNVKWAVNAGLLNGMGDGTLTPRGSATRAQIAAILHRFSDNFVK